jgi:hypothetical protein
MWNAPTEKQLAKLPNLHATEGVPIEEKVVHMHFFIGGCDWYVVEYDPNDRLFFGYAILNEDYENAEWGYIPLDELVEIKVPPGIEIDRDKWWKPTRAGEVEKIVKSGGVPALNPIREEEVTATVGEIDNVPEPEGVEEEQYGLRLWK